MFRSAKRQRRRWAAFFLLLSLALVVFGVMLLSGMGSPDQQPVASGGVDKATVERAASVRGADAPEAVSGREEDKKTAAEKNEVDKEAAQKADEKAAASDQAARKPDPKKRPAIPTPPT